ncbi:MAG TPA: ribonuclease III [Anaerolineaceae bacterium]|nr:ribonuclease III [Anaerolineaceae bacterium]HNS36426.1 ribonuclease III [Anaerolineaceae bacterium]HNZ12941.1 ribonuclease III [Anaerolineaceae bacterium]HOD04123.1 ribonuclease III [Anaerolineaceae bacterium]HOG79417.1 ribonuclease III [Anaerolineaceae bacterium]
MERPEFEGEHEAPLTFAHRVGLQFTDWLLLSRALTHRSYLNEHPEALEDNERLEFLGDAVLDFMVGAWLYNEYPEMPEGDLTRMRSALVYTEQLAVFARELDLGLALRLGRGEMQGGGRDRDPLLCDAFEALIGALYLDGGIPAVERFMAPMLTRAADDILINRKNEDPKSRLQEWAQAQGYATPHYETTSVTGPDHSKVFEVSVLIRGEVWATGTGHSKQAAAKEAARLALEKIGQDIT